MCCSPIREAVRAAKHYYTKALQTMIHGKECYTVIVIYLPSRHLRLRYNYRTMFRNNRPSTSIPLIHGSRGLHSITGERHLVFPVRASMGMKPAATVYEWE